MIVLSLPPPVPVLVNTLPGLPRRASLTQSWPVERDGILDLAVNLQFPLAGRHIRLDSQIEHGKIVNQPLARRHSVHGASRGPGFACHLSRPMLFRRDLLILHSRSREFLEI